MSQIGRRARLAGMLALSLVAVEASFAHASGGGTPGVVAVAPAPTRRVAFKPSYHVRQNRTLFLTGYAGVTYGRAPVAPLTPTLYAPGNGRPFGGVLGRIFGR